MGLKKPDVDAALHLALGALKPGEIPVGHHDLSNCQLVLTFPSFAAVDRAAGSAGDGFDIGKPPEMQLSPNAVLLFLEGNRSWRECIQLAERGAIAEPPAEALSALAQLQSEAPPLEPVNRKTPAKRTGEKQIEIKLKRLPKQVVTG